MATDGELENPSGDDAPEARFGRSLPPWSYPRAVYGLLALVIVGPFGTWLTLHFGGHPVKVAVAGYHSGSPAWPLLGLVIAAVIATTASVALRHSEWPLVVAALFAALTIVIGTSIVQYGLFDVGLSPESFTIGWGQWLCFASSLLGTAIATAWVRSRRRSREFGGSPCSAALGG